MKLKPHSRYNMFCDVMGHENFSLIRERARSLGKLRTDGIRTLLDTSLYAILRLKPC